jgi:hypothetical protein
MPAKEAQETNRLGLPLERAGSLQGALLFSGSLFQQAGSYRQHVSDGTRLETKAI